jgi:hypothetical protein
MAQGKRYEYEFETPRPRALAADFAAKPSMKQRLP